MHFTVRKCKIIPGHLLTDGSEELLSLKDATERLAPSKTQRALNNLISVKAGYYIGTLKPADKADSPSNFIFKNPTTNGDIRWLSTKSPGFESKVLDIYQIIEVQKENTAIDLPPIGNHAPLPGI